MQSKAKDRNILIRELPVDTDYILNVLAVQRGVHKWQVIRDALITYADENRLQAATTSNLRRLLGPRLQDNKEKKV